MKSIFDFFDGGSWLNIIFLLLTIFSIVIAFYFYFKAKKEKSPVFNKQTIRLLQPKLAKLKNIEIKYVGQVINNLSLTRLAFWNSGKESIRKEDIPINDPLQIVTVGEVKIYDVEIDFENKVNNFFVEKINDNLISISFDFIDFNEGVILNVYHSGFDSKELAINGTLIGANKISNGIKKNKVLKSLDFFFAPTNYLMSSDKIILKILGFPIALSTILIVIPLAPFIFLVNYLYNRVNVTYPKKFDLSE